MRHRLILIVLFTLATAGLARLGFWQLERAEQKRERHNAYTLAASAPSLNLDNLDRNASDSYLWRPTKMFGRFHDSHVLLDNRSLNGRIGYEVLSPFTTDGGRVVLVNRGWLPLTGSRAEVPALAVGDDDFSLAGYLADVPVVGIALNDEASRAEWLNPQTLRVQRVDIAGLAALLGHDLWPLVLYLDPDQAGALTVDWQPPGDGSSRHTAYAVQWFAMAAVLASIGLWNLRRSISRSNHVEST